MKPKCFLLFISALILISQSGFAEYYYCELGQRQLQVCDSLITIRFDPAFPSPDFGAFAYSVPALDEARMPEEGYRGFYTYWVESGYDFDSLIEDLRSIDIVLYAFPSYLDSYGNLYRLTDLFLVSYSPGVSQSQIDSIQSFYNVEHLDGPFPYTGTRRLLMTPLSPGNTLDIANAFYESGLVEYAQALMSPPTPDSYEPDDPLFPAQYYLHNTGQTGGTPGIDINIRMAWEITQGDSNDVVIAILDDGFVQQHEDVEESKVLWYAGHDFIGDNWRYPAEDDDPSPGDSSNHGVACQGIISAKAGNSIGIAGIAPKCNILPIKIAGDHEFGNYQWPWDASFYERAISYAMHFALDSNYPFMVISCSWGWPYGEYHDNIARIIDTAWLNNVILVFSTGNLGERYPSGQSIKFPASLPKTVGVGAVRKTGVRWTYSGWGDSVDVVAPSGYYYGYDSGDIFTLDQMGQLGWNPTFSSCYPVANENYFCTYGGTSAAVPQVAGIIALLLSRVNMRPELRLPSILKTIIDSSARDGIGGPDDPAGYDLKYGNGLVSAFRALLSVSRGDANNNGVINIIDASYLTAFLYKGGPPPNPDTLMGDANCSGTVNMLDVSFILSYLYKGGPEPPICFNYGN